MNLGNDLYRPFNDDTKDDDLARRKNYLDMVEGYHVIIVPSSSRL